MAIKARDYIAKLPDREQKAIKAEAKKLIAEELTLSGIREALRQSQVEVAAKLGVQQPAVSKIEHRPTCISARCTVSSRPWVETWKSSLGFPIGLP